MAERLPVRPAVPGRKGVAVTITGHELVAETLGEPVDHTRSDVGNGELLVRRHGANLRYVHPWQRWLVWDGRRWHDDDTGRPDALMKETLRWLATDANELANPDERKRQLRFALDSERAGRVRAALEMAQSEPGIPVVPDELDLDPWALNVGNGTLDLRSGSLRAHDRADLITRCIETDYCPGAMAPIWTAFLHRVLGGDEKLIQFVQRAVGYSLTGLTTEQVILLVFGAGANGKSTFITTLLDLLGPYAQQAPAETFIERRDSIPNDVARLRGTRFVAAAEIGEGRRLNEALVKRMTGGDKITARFMRAEWFEFVPQFTPWLATNHRPEIVGTDVGIWRRVRLIPFTITIPENERDPLLPRRLQRELPGILAWAVQGCLDWQEHGLAAPPAVVTATKAYRADMDVIGQFLDECCNLEPNTRVKASVLHARLDYWSKENGHDTITQKALASRLSERGYQRERTRDGVHWLGIALEEREG